jgi:general secretion pathway protein N
MTRTAALAIAAAVLGVGLGPAGAQVPMPLQPPTAGAPPPPPPPGSVPSPILRGPGAVPLGPQPAYPSPVSPGPLDQQQLQAYRNNLITQQRQMEREGVSPANPRYRDIQQQLQQLGR